MREGKKPIPVCEKYMLNRGGCKMFSSHHRRPGETKGRKSGGWIYWVPVFG